MRGENAQTVYRTERKPGFAQIPNEALRDERLSWRARGLLAYMLSFPDDWAHRADDLQHEGIEGREAVRKALRELEAVGYRTRAKRRDEAGQIRTFIVLRDYVPESTEDREPVGRSSGQSVDRASYEDGHEDCHEEPLTGTGEQQALVDVEPTPKPKAERPRDPVFDAIAAVFPSATKSESKLIAIVAHELRPLRPDPEEIIRRARWCVREWPGSTPKALAQHWSQIGERLRASTHPDDTADVVEDPHAGMDTGRFEK